MTTLKRAIKERYPKYAEKMILRFEDATGEQCTWDALTKPNLSRFVGKLQEEVSQNSAKQYIAMFKAVLNLYSEMHSLPGGWDKVASVKADMSQHIYLTDDEVQALLDYKPANRNERYVRNSFVLSCLTGARHSDAMAFTKSNVSGGFLTYVSRKTRIESRVPVSPAVERLLDENKAYNFGKMEVTGMTYNLNIRKICRSVGINSTVKVYCGGEYSEGEKWEFVASHTARRSFATNLYLYNVDGIYPFEIRQISEMLGHSSVEMTERYIVASRPFTDSGISYFTRFR